MDIKDKILKVADRQYHLYGVRSVSMDDIARELGMSKKTIYQYYKDKDELVYTVCQFHIEADKKDFIEADASSDNAIDALFQFSKCIKKNLSEINSSLLFDLQKFHPSSWQLWREYKSTFIKEVIIKMINRGKQEGVFRSEVNAEILARYRIETIQMAFDPQIFPTNEYKLTDLQMELFDHFVYGLLSESGYKMYDDLKRNIR